jgi:hypothetical protein
LSMVIQKTLHPMMQKRETRLTKGERRTLSVSSVLMRNSA